MAVLLRPAPPAQAQVATARSLVRHVDTEQGNNVAISLVGLCRDLVPRY